jgi:hypothetical protein
VLFVGLMGKYRNVFLGILLSLVIGASVRSGITFKQSWEKQLNFYWQLYWRAPALEPNTMLVSDGEFLFYMGAAPTVFAVNTLYPQSVPFPELSYWVSSSTERMPDWDAFRAGAALEFTAHSSNFHGESKDSITFSFLPDDAQCLWLLSSRYGNYPFLSAGMFESLPVSALDRIHPDSAGWIPPADIFGPEPDHSWCYYFQKADLAAQQGDWEKVIDLWEQAQSRSLRPGHGVELFPFVRAQASRGGWGEAVELTVSASKISPQMRSAICNLWTEMGKDTQPSDARLEAFTRIDERFQCGF